MLLLSDDWDSGQSRVEVYHNFCGRLTGSDDGDTQRTSARIA